MKALLLSSHLSHCNSVRLSVTRVDQSKAVQARITEFSPSAARNYSYAKVGFCACIYFD